MKKRNLAMSVAAICVVSGFLLSGCNGQKQIDSNQIEYVKVDEEVHLLDDTSSPACKITIDYGYLTESNESDTIAQRINHTVQTATLGKEYANMSATVAVDSFKTAYVHNYRRDVAELYQEDIQNGTPKEDLPSWYNYEYSLTNTYNEGKEGVLNYATTTFEYSGGAHPNEWSKWMNFDFANGELLPLDKVFIKGSEAPMAKMLQDKLIEEMAAMYPGEKVESLDDLQNLGILIDTNIYVPENFLLEKDQASFLYNKYDIAPYAVGMIILSLPYTEIEKYMIH